MRIKNNRRYRFFYESMRRMRENALMKWLIFKINILFIFSFLIKWYKITTKRFFSLLCRKRIKNNEAFCFSLIFKMRKYLKIEEQKCV